MMTWQAFFIGFLLEMLLKLCALGPSEYFLHADGRAFNRFDAAVVLLSSLEMAQTYFDHDLGLHTQVLRAFRLLRVFKLARSWPSLYLVVRALLTMLHNLRDLLIVLVVVLLVFALLGMQVFGGGQLHFEHRDLYDNIEHALVTVFITVTGEHPYPPYHPVPIPSPRPVPYYLPTTQASIGTRCG